MQVKDSIFLNIENVGDNSVLGSIISYAYIYNLLGLELTYTWVLHVVKDTEVNEVARQAARVAKQGYRIVVLGGTFKEVYTPNALIKKEEEEPQPKKKLIPIEDIFGVDETE